MRLLACLLAALATTTALGGCLGTGDDAQTAGLPDAVTGLAPDWFERSYPWGDGHDHIDHAEHAGLTTANFEIVGYDPLVTSELGTTASGMGCGGAATRDDGQRLAVAHGFSSPMGFVVADITDPAQPTLVGEFMLPNVNVWDATITADGMHALVAADPDRSPTLPPLAGVARAPLELRPLFRNACTGEVQEAGPVHYVPYGPSVMLVSLADPANPMVEDVVPQPVLGPHSVSSQRIDGAVYAISSVTNLQHEASYYSFFEVTETALGGRLVPLTVIQAPGHPPLQSFNGHVEAELHKHPATNQLVAYLANWDEGIVLYDMTDPRVPVHLGTWKEESGLGNMHSVLPLDELRDGVHYTIAGQEIGEGSQDEPGLVFLLDTTDPANPVEVSRWTFPDKPVGWDWGLQFSTHYFDVAGDLLFVSAYHGGVWAVDVSEPAAPMAVGVFVPDRVSPAPPSEGRGLGPSVEDVIADEDGTLTVWDADGGIYQLRFDASLDAPHAPTWYDVQGTGSAP